LIGLVSGSAVVLCVVIGVVLFMVRLKGNNGTESSTSHLTLSKSSTMSGVTDAEGGDEDSSSGHGAGQAAYVAAVDDDIEGDVEALSTIYV